MAKTKDKTRCPWVGSQEQYLDYHDTQWGVPVHDDRELFECLTLEGAQAGLSWSTILAKRDNYRKAFSNFEIEKVARFTPAKKEKLMNDAGIVRNRLKIESTVSNARALKILIKEQGSFDAYLWNFVDGKPIQSNLKIKGDYPAKTDISTALSKDLKKRGFRFVGPTIVYAFMQATGMVNDHALSCFRHKPVSRMK